MKTLSKNIVICADGTGNSYFGPKTNVLQLFEMALKQHDRQIACYDPGIGTLPLPSGRSELGRKLRHWKELGLGTGIMDNVADLYRYLMCHYRDGDRVFLFGFSRGAFTVRALAGMLHFCGLISVEDQHLLPYVTGLYLSAEDRISRVIRAQRHVAHLPDANADHAVFDDEAATFRANKLSRSCPVHFLGVWDTVKAYGWFVPRSFPSLRHNPSVGIVRHAVALDEQRSPFQVTGWGTRGETVKEVWFAGDHADVGGGHPDGSPLADAALLWMLGEATTPEAGLLLNQSFESAVTALQSRAARAAMTTPHNLRPDKFWILDYIPKQELDNSVYPPYRLWRAGKRGIRKPADHDEHAEVVIHHSVAARASLDSSYDAAALLARSRHLQRKVTIRKEPEQDRPIEPAAWVSSDGALEETP